MKNSGFTLMEIIIVVAIFGILLGIGAMSGRDWLERARVEGQTKEMYVDLMNARVCALQRSRVFFVHLPTTNQYAIYEDTHPSPDGDGTLQTENDRLVMQKTTLFPLQPHMSFGHTTFHFEQDGLVSHNGVILFDSAVDPASDCIKLFSTRILVGKWNGSSSTCISQ
jgi:prepilin-type N-terminal cleavage/methylation domain-containing protein